MKLIFKILSIISVLIFIDAGPIVCSVCFAKAATSCALCTGFMLPLAPFYCTITACTCGAACFLPTI